jgi:beta-glucosidase
MADLKEKIALLDGLDVWHTKPIDGLPSLMMSDGPHGLRKQVSDSDNLGIGGSVPATCFPTASLFACSWDVNLVKLLAKTIAQEAKANGVNIVLGPGINIKRSPLCGRNFEYYSEDPYLTGVLASAYVRAMEDEGVGTSVKHFFCNNQEKNRFIQDSVVDERAMHEIYLKAFKMCVKEKPASLMASYNKINGEYGTEHSLLKTLVRDKWGYDGLIITDWAACNNRVLGLLHTCDLEMPTSSGYNAKKILEASNDSKVIKAIDDSYERITKTVKKYSINRECTVDYDQNYEISRQIAANSMVLLKNDRLLPLAQNESVAIIGAFVDEARYQGGGSSHINPYKLLNIRDIINEYSDKIRLAKGFNLDGYKDEELTQEAVDIASQVDKVILLVGVPPKDESEGFDRLTLSLPDNQIALLEALLAVNPNLIVCCFSGSVVNLSFEEKVKGLVMAYLPGEAYAHSLLDVLYGKVNPSGRLTETFIDDISQCNVTLNDDIAVYYDESIFVGYRYYETFNQKVRFPFGYGLSYTEFAYDDFCVTKVKDNHYQVEVKVKNVGKYPGQEVVQLYRENNQGTVYKPKRELIAFTKVMLEVNETVVVKFDINEDSFTHYDVKVKDFIIEGGTYKLALARNVHDIICFHEITLVSDERFTPHEATSYNQETYDVSDFAKIYQLPLPPRKVKPKRPFSLNNTLVDLRKTLMGKLIYRFVMKEANKLSRDMTEEWMKEVMIKSMEETPLRGLATMSGGALPLPVAEGIIDLVNLHCFRGLKKIIKGLNNGQ